MGRVSRDCPVLIMAGGSTDSSVALIMACVHLQFSPDHGSIRITEGGMITEQSSPDLGRRTMEGTVWSWLRREEQ